ncbi:succinyl-CoA synthetase subunit beta [Sulfitobacter noctilucae]|uniref:succinyl-CoA synthetase subunit beta n=1 Tax=Sulfitobacter noctilucae TaxID=1342302 RepID=UPI001267D027|nr:succinyl-CoA synthetase subunit beta [Sulfitobacter noctilucae]
MHCSKLLGIAVATLVSASVANAGSAPTTARMAMQLFADHCFSPYMTAAKARETFSLKGVDHDFYDLDPFSSAAPSPATGRAVTPGTDRRCEVSFAGDHAENAASAAVRGLAVEKILQPADLPASYTETATTTLLAARRLNPRRVAVVHVATRGAANTLETFMLVERLAPSHSTN